MFVDELTRIRESENQADQIRKEARAEARSKLEKARADAAEAVEQARSRARDICDSLAREGRDEFEKEYAAFLEKTRQECMRMKDEAEGRKEKATALIAERIVSASVNC